MNVNTSLLLKRKGNEIIIDNRANYLVKNIIRSGIYGEYFIRFSFSTHVGVATLSDVKDWRESDQSTNGDVNGGTNFFDWRDNLPSSRCLEYEFNCCIVSLWGCVVIWAN